MSGAHAHNRVSLAERRRADRRTFKAVVAALALCGVLAVGGTVAYLTASTPELVNTFEAAAVSTEVSESFDGSVKSNVAVRNTGSVDAYVRAAVVVSWKDANGNVYGQNPTSNDYSLVLSTDAADGKDGVWILGSDGFYYWTAPVAPYAEGAEDGLTGTLIASCVYVANAPEGYSLSVEIIGSGIQSLPTDVVAEVWASGVAGVNADGTLDVIEQA